MTSLEQMVGMPVVWEGKTLGYVERGVLTKSGKRLQGLVVRRGLGSAKWIPCTAILVIGQSCVLVCAQSSRMPKAAETRLTRAYLTGGESAGMVTDALIRGDTLRVAALEVSDGPVYRLLGRKAYATAYALRQEAPYDKAKKAVFEIIISQLCTWAELQQGKGKEGVP